MDTIQLIILAGGKGTRMLSEHPKVLVELGGKPLITHLLDNLRPLSLSIPPVIVVGHEAELVKETIGPSYRYALQQEQKGTGHAVLMAREATDARAKHVMVLYGDHPLVDADTIRAITETHQKNNAVVTMGTASVPDFTLWRSAFKRYGRIIRDEHGTISRIVEYKDATEAERAITEVNPSYLCFQADWLWSRLQKIGVENAQNEYYLTDIIGIATQEGVSLHTTAIDPEIALGANTREELETLENILNRR